jgi:hypothetical protein
LVEVVGIGRAVGNWRRALVIGMVLALLLLGLVLLPGGGANIEGNISSPPSIFGLQAR